MTKLLHSDLTDRIIGVYYRVYNKLSQTYPEFIYERAMAALLEREGLRCVRQDEYEVHYKERVVGLQRLDIFVAGEVVVELKVADQITPLHLAQLLSYLKVVSKPVGLLFRFGGPAPDFTRRVLTDESWSARLAPNALTGLDRQNSLYSDTIQEIVAGALEVFKALGPGFVHRIYANACHHELKLRGLAVKPHREMQVFMDGIDLGTVKLGHLQVADQAMMFPVAVSDIDRIKPSNLRAWMRYLGIPLGVVINFKAKRLGRISAWGQVW